MTEDEDTFDPENEMIIRAKWVMDGAKTLDEAAAKLRAEADDLMILKSLGWELADEIYDDYGTLIRNAPQDPAVEKS